MNLNHFKNSFGLDEQDFLLFPYGSQVYLTATEKSDHDFLAIILEKDCETGTEYQNDKINIQIYSKEDFSDQLKRHKVKALEVYYNKSCNCSLHFPFKLDRSILRESIVEKASHAFVKAKKKIDVEKDFYIGWKSLFHSLRILTFGIQIAKTEQIEFSSANNFWREIIENPQYNWQYYKERYQPIYNELATEFRKVAPK